MLDMDTLQHLYDLTAYTLYDAETARLPRLSREEQVPLLERARQGDEEARHALILNCLRFVLMKAHQVYRAYQPTRIDILDLAATANLEMLENMDKALALNDPTAYLMSVGINEMRRYCLTKAPFIQLPAFPTRKLARHKTFVESLDEPEFDEENERIHVELMEAPMLSVEEDEQEQERFAPLYEAMRMLKPKQQSIIIRLYGLFEQPTVQTNAEIAQELHIRQENVRYTAFLARQTLRSLLSPHLAKMLRPKPKRQKE